MTGSQILQRKPRRGEYFIFHDYPEYVYQIVALIDGIVTYTNLHSGESWNDEMKHFNEFHTRVPI